MTDVFNSQDDDNSSENILDQLVGEGKKFATPEDLAKGKQESDKFIAQLETEMKALREERDSLSEKAKEAATLQEMLDKLKSKSDSKSEDGNHPATSSDELTKLVEEAIKKTKEQDSRSSNRQRASEEVLKRFNGDAAEAKKFVKAKATELNMTPEKLGELAETSPEAYATLLGLKSNSSGSGSVRSVPGQVNGDALNLPQGERNVQFYRDLKSKDAKAFWSPKVQQEIYKLAKVDPEVVSKILS